MLKNKIMILLSRIICFHILLNYGNSRDSINCLKLIRSYQIDQKEEWNSKNIMSSDAIKLAEKIVQQKDESDAEARDEETIYSQEHHDLWKWLLERHLWFKTDNVRFLPLYVTPIAGYSPK